MLMCMKLCNVRINLRLLDTVIDYICLVECRLVVTNDLKLSRFYDFHAVELLY